MIIAEYKCGYCGSTFKLSYFNSVDIPERNVGCTNCRMAGEKVTLIEKIRDERNPIIEEVEGTKVPEMKIDPGKPFVPTEGMDKKIKSHLLYPITVLEAERDNVPHQPGSLIAQLNKAIEILNNERRKIIGDKLVKL